LPCIGIASRGQNQERSANGSPALCAVNVLVVTSARFIGRLIRGPRSESPRQPWTGSAPSAASAPYQRPAAGTEYQRPAPPPAAYNSSHGAWSASFNREGGFQPSPSSQAPPPAPAASRPQGPIPSQPSSGPAQSTPTSKVSPFDMLHRPHKFHAHTSTRILAEQEPVSSLISAGDPSARSGPCQVQVPQVRNGV
jgi:hypothetical protein